MYFQISLYLAIICSFILPHSQHCCCCQIYISFNINNNMGTCQDIGSNRQGIWKHDGEVHKQKTGSSKESALALFLEASNDF